MAAAKESIPATGPSIPNIRKFKGTISISNNVSSNHRAYSGTKIQNTKASMNFPDPIVTLLAFFGFCSQNVLKFL